jgi:hypothetical protein
MGKTGREAVLEQEQNIDRGSSDRRESVRRERQASISGEME